MVLSQEKYKDLLDYIIQHFKPMGQDEKEFIPCSISRQSDARGLFNPITEELTVLKGGKINPDNLPSLKPSARKKREEQVKKYARKENGKLVVKKNLTFKSPSGATTFCIGGAADGWISWTDDEGKKLMEYRKK